MKHEDLIALEMIAHRIVSRHVAEEMKRYRKAQRIALAQLKEMFGEMVDPAQMKTVGCAPDCPRCYDRRVNYILGKLVRRKLRMILNKAKEDTKLNSFEKSIDDKELIK